MLPLLLAPIVQIATNIVIGVVLDRLAKFRADTDWTKVKIDADTKVRSIIPGAAFDDVAVRACNAAIDKIRSAMGETAEAEKVLSFLATGDFGGAAKELMQHVSGKAA